MKRRIILLLPAAVCGVISFAMTPDSTSSARAPEPVGYGRGIVIDRNEASAAISSADGEALGHRTAINPSNLLYGLIPGLQVMQNAGNAWDDGATLYVRGIGTSGTAAPLVLVDGFERPIDKISACDIESVTVLKDAVSTSLYGLRGANGVVLITTKRGAESSAPKIDFSYQFNMGTPRNIPVLVNGYTYAHALNEGLRNDGSKARYTDAELRAFWNGTYPDFYPDVDWWGESIRDHSYGHDAALSASGGGKHVKYYTMLNYQHDSGILKPVNWNDGYSTQFRYSRMNVRTNLDITISKTTRAKLNMFGSFSEQNRPGQTSDAIFAALYKVPSGAFTVRTANGVFGGTTTYSNNPVAYIAGSGYVRTQGRVLYADLELEQDLDFITKGLSAAVRVGIDNYTTYQDSNTRNFAYEYAAMDMTSGTQRYTTLRNEGTLSFGKSVTESSNHFNLEARLNWDRQWGGHRLNSVVMYSMDENTVKNQNASRAFMDVIGQFHYSFLNRYIVDFSISGSASGVFEPGHRWGVFPAVGAAWVLSEEPFMDCSWLNLMKFRASWGISGLADYDLNLYRDQYGNKGSYWFGEQLAGLSGLAETVLGISGLTYEKSHKANFGIDMEIFNRLSLSVDAFYDRRTDILVDASGITSSILGISVPKSNDGIVDNYGAEAYVNWNDRAGDFSYNIGGTFSFTRNRIIAMNEQYRPYDYMRRTGRSVGQIFGYVVEGIYQTREQIDNREVKQYLSEVYPGDLMFRDQNDDNRIDENDMVPIGYNNLCPEIWYSFWVGAEFKGIGLYALFQGAGNYSTILSVNSVYRPLINDNTVSAHYYRNRWTPENPDARYPRLTYAGSANNYNNNTLWVEDGSFLKLRTLELSYRLPENLLRKTKSIRDVRIFARAHDLFSWDRLEAMDPENMDDGHPLMTQCTFGINLSF